VGYCLLSELFVGGQIKREEDRLRQRVEIIEEEEIIPPATEHLD
jgi:hypothetical protein